MKRYIVEGSEYLMWKDKLVQVNGIFEGEYQIVIMKWQEPCPHCGGLIDKEDAQSSSSTYFQDNAAPVKTIKANHET